jgi:DnaK suppressor protein
MPVAATAFVDQLPRTNDREGVVVCPPPELREGRSAMPRSQKPADTEAASGAKKTVGTRTGAPKSSGAGAATKKAPRTPAAKGEPGHSSHARSARKQPAAADATRKSVPREADAGTVDDDRPYADFLVEQRLLLLEERTSYTRQAEELKAEADSLALEHEPGDVQFDEEGGEGGTSNVDRELDLVLSAQARAAITEIDRALAKIDAGTYGVCEQCGEDIPQARLRALPYAALCVGCKSGGLSRRG